MARVDSDSSANPGSSRGTAHQAPKVAIPKGGGAIRGIGEKFGTNPATGTGSLAVPIAISQGRAGFQPELTLSYDSGSGNGAFGFGWTLSAAFITRKTDKGLPRYGVGGARDVFMISGAEDLVPGLRRDGDGWAADESFRTVATGTYRVLRYRPRVERSFARIEQWTHTVDPADVSWRTISGDNVTAWFGRTPESRVVDPENPEHIFSWLLCESYDDAGNAARYEYKAENSDGVDAGLLHERNRDGRMHAANRYLKRIHYGNRTPRQPDEQLAERNDWLFEVVLDYGEHDPEAPTTQEQSPWSVRTDPFSSYRSAFEIRTHRLCRRVLMFHHFSEELGVDDCLVRSTSFSYSESAIGSFLTSVTQSGHIRRADGTYLTQSLPPLELEYSQAVVQDDVQELSGENLYNLPYGADGTHYKWADLDGEGVSGVVTEQATAWFYKRNLSPVVERTTGSPLARALFEGVEVSREAPGAVMEPSGRRQLLDLSGDGQIDVVDLAGPVAGFFERTHDEGWEAFVPFDSRPNVAWTDSNVRLVDLTGDGHADVLVAEHDGFYWYPSQGEAGFGPAETVRHPMDEDQGARSLLEEGTQSIFLADMSGDGLSDLVRIRNGDVCYWPNLGYGRFGAKVSMDRAPWFDSVDQFDGQRLRLADIDGSGVTDLIYLGSDGVRIYFNQSGNSWSDARRLEQFPAIDNLAAVEAVDLLGNGTACLVWSSPLSSDAGRAMRYVDLMGGLKPHLLIGIDNNLGAVTHVQYASSTRFYLEDKQAGRPWVTRLPFPVHVVERVEVHDRVSRNRFVSRYTYRHGLFDGIEREFRGFGFVEQRDTEEFAVLADQGALPDSSNNDLASHVPPAVTRTWFHLGVHREGAQISRLFEDEYYPTPGHSLDDPDPLLLPDTVLPAGMSEDDEREASRALKGMTLRQEIYARDGTDAEEHPYSITEHNYSIEQIQPRESNEFGVFFTHARETITCQYERRPHDPRVRHDLVLSVDEFGNVLRSSTVDYSRRVPDLTLSEAERAAQNATVITYGDTRYTNAVQLDDDYRTPLPADERTYEVLNVRSPGPDAAAVFDFADLSGQIGEAADGAHDLPFEDLTRQGIVDDHPYRRLLDRTRMLYRSNDLTGGLAVGVLESRALAFDTYRCAFTPGLLASILGDRVDDTVLLEGGYVRFADDVAWWAPSGRVFFSRLSSASPAEEFMQAISQFFLPERFEDPFGNATTVTYDRSRSGAAYSLFPAITRDAVGNEVVAAHDYRVLQPRLLTDANGNRSAVMFDALGLVTATAVMGKEDPSEGDTLDGIEIDDVAAIAHLHDPFAAPHAALGNATSRILYDVFAYRRTRDQPEPRPAVVCTLARETHRNPLADGGLPRIQQSFSYADGLGREIQGKLQAEPGPLVQDGPPQPHRWVGSGWTVFNNKGQPVREFEPFFSATHEFEFARTNGVSTISFYDPLGRLVSALHPNHTWTKTVVNVWRQEAWDVNDTVLLDPRLDDDARGFFTRLDESEFLPSWHQQRLDGLVGATPVERAAELVAARQAERHASTPAIEHRDAQGRTFLAVAHNRFERDDVMVDRFEATRFNFDVEGHDREAIDARRRTVRRCDYDMLGNVIHCASMESGERWMLHDVTGSPIRAWDSRVHAFRTEFDALRRPVRALVRGVDQDDPARELLVERTEYGEEQPDSRERNLRTRVFRSFDGAGLMTNVSFDFKGNLQHAERQYAVDHRRILDWSAELPLTNEVFLTMTTFDALNRPLNVVTHAGVVQYRYNEANLLEAVDVSVGGTTPPASFVRGVDYDAKGRRRAIEYGNGVVTVHDYDALTFRLARTRSTSTGRSTLLQDLSYTYDPIGNITSIRDEAQSSVFFNNAVVDAAADFGYDAVYQLVSATGREHVGQLSAPQTNWDGAFRVDLPHPHDGGAMRRYTERYEYDEVGNQLRLIHRADGGNWTRTLSYEEASTIVPSEPGNRLTRSEVGGTVDSYGHDPHGNMTRMPHLPEMQWDHNDRLRSSSLQVVNSGLPETTHYLYAMAGHRTRTVTDAQSPSGDPARRRERIYIGAFERLREFDGSTVMAERHTLHVLDGEARLAMVETAAVADGEVVIDPRPRIRYQLAGHLGSVAIETDDAGAIISYEEYYPFGSTSYQATAGNVDVSPRRYRYVGKERDADTGLYYCGTRFYASWLCRWISADPAGFVDGTNLFRYVRNNPVAFIDHDGGNSESFMKKFTTMMAEVVVVSTTGIPLNTLKQIAAPKPNERYAIDSYGRQEKIPQGQRTGGNRIEGHHPVQDQWAKKNIQGYGTSRATSQFLETGTGEEHTAISEDQKAKRPSDGDWTNKSTSAAFEEAAEQYKAAGLMTNEKHGLEALLKAYGSFFELSDKVHVDKDTGKRTVVKNANFKKQLLAAERKAKVLAALAKGGNNVLKALGPVGIYFGLEASAEAAERGEYGTAALELGTTAAGAVGDVIDAGRAGGDIGEAMGEYHGIYESSMEHGAAVEELAASLGAGETLSSAAGAVGAFYSAGYQAEIALLPHNVYGMAYDLAFN